MIQQSNNLKSAGNSRYTGNSKGSLGSNAGASAIAGGPVR
jgi:hypothetical protein